MSTTAGSSTAFPDLLRQWRRDRGLSQLQLAAQSGSSQRHISFLESGRARPSPVMVFALSEALSIPLRYRNEMLLAAGFAPRYQARSLDDPDMEQASRALEAILEAQKPYPAFVFDRLYNILRANEPAMRLTGFLFEGLPPEEMAALAGNIIRGALHPRGCWRFIENWEELAGILLRRLQAELRAAGPAHNEANALFEEVTSWPHIPAGWRQLHDADWQTPMLTVAFNKDGVRFNLFSTLTSLGAPYDATLQDLRIESYFPADDAARAFFEEA